MKYPKRIISYRSVKNITTSNPDVDFGIIRKWPKGGSKYWYDTHMSCQAILDAIHTEMNSTNIVSSNITSCPENIKIIYPLTTFIPRMNWNRNIREEQKRIIMIKSQLAIEPPYNDNTPLWDKYGTGSTIPFLREYSKDMCEFLNTTIKEYQDKNGTHIAEDILRTYLQCMFPFVDIREYSRTRVWKKMYMFIKLYTKAKAYRLYDTFAKAIKDSPIVLGDSLYYNNSTMSRIVSRKSNKMFEFHFGDPISRNCSTFVEFCIKHTDLTILEVWTYIWNGLLYHEIVTKLYGLSYQEYHRRLKKFKLHLKGSIINLYHQIFAKLPRPTVYREEIIKKPAKKQPKNTRIDEYIPKTSGETLLSVLKLPLIKWPVGIGGVVLRENFGNRYIETKQGKIFEFRTHIEMNELITNFIDFCISETQLSKRAMWEIMLRLGLAELIEEEVNLYFAKYHLKVYRRALKKFTRTVKANVMESIQEMLDICDKN